MANVNDLLVFFIAVFLFSRHGADGRICLHPAWVPRGTWLHGWQNHWDSHLKTLCPNGALTGIHSIHDNGRQDRLFNFACSSLYNKGHHQYNTHCYWGSWSWWHQRHIYGCLSNYYVAGWESYHNNGRGDRRMRYQCCTSSRVILYGCHMTHWRNHFDQAFTYRTPENYVISLADTSHSYHHKDRRFTFTVCKAYFV